MSGLVEIDGVKVSMSAAEEDGKCELCGKVEETRPYGPNGERSCFDCGQKDRAVTERQMGRVLFGEEQH
jgi:hypothetical protein